MSVSALRLYFGFLAVGFLAGALAVAVFLAAGFLAAGFRAGARRTGLDGALGWGGAGPAGRPGVRPPAARSATPRRRPCAARRWSRRRSRTGRTGRP